MSLSRFIRHETILAVLVVIALIVLAAQSDKFFTLDNLLNQGRLMTEVGLIAVIMTFVIITGGIDLSVGSIRGMTAILFAAIGSAMIFVNVSPYWLRAVIGVLILVTVLVDMARRAREFRSAQR